MTSILVTRAGPLTTLQDAGRFGLLGQGISASGPMDRGAYLAAGALLDVAGNTAIEITVAGLDFTATGPVRVGCAGGRFSLLVNGDAREWPAKLDLLAGDRVSIAPGTAGNYGYVRFEREFDVAPVLGSRSTNVAVGLGGYKGRALRAGDRIALGVGGVKQSHVGPVVGEGPIRVIWGLHADLFETPARSAFVRSPFTITTSLDRMGVRLADPLHALAGPPRLSLVSDAIVPGDIQVLGDGTPIVLMRDHHPTGGYPRIATVASADLDRFAQLRPGTEVHFQPVTVERAR